VLDEYPELADVAVVPLGVSAYSSEARMRAHTQEEARFVVETVDAWQEVFLAAIGRRMVFAADEYYLLAGMPFPPAGTYGDFSMHEDGIGMARAFEMEFQGGASEGIGVQPGFFASVDGAPAVGYRAPRTAHQSEGGQTLLQLMPRRTAPVGILTGEYGAQVLAPLVSSLDRSDVRIVTVENKFFGGNISVAGLMVGEDLQRVLALEPVGHRYLLPDVCLSQGRFLDGLTPEDLPRPVEIIPTDGVALREALEPLTNTRTTSSETDAR
jgi:NifB/MoaA-like Fe-S oxidoreductase